MVVFDRFQDFFFKPFGRVCIESQIKLVKQLHGERIDDGILWSYKSNINLNSFVEIGWLFRIHIVCFSCQSQCKQVN